MTESPDKRPESPENGSKRRFDPFTHEEDMFKVVLWVGGAVLAVAVIAGVVSLLL